MGGETLTRGKSPELLLLGPVPPILFLITEARGVAGADRTGPAPVFIPAEAARRLAQSLLPTPPGPGERGGDPGPRIRGAGALERRV